MDALGPSIEPRAVLHRDRATLLELVADLTPLDWTRPTACELWQVGDLVAHLVGDDLSRLSRSRDGHDGGDAPAPDESFPEFIARLNDRWVTACSGLSPTVLADLLVSSTAEVLEFWDELDLNALGDPVSWAGPDPAPRWLDCARDFTEYWTHHRQLREATGRPHSGDPDVDHVALDTFLRAVPYTLRDVVGPESVTVTVEVTGPAGGSWSWRRDADIWRWALEHPAAPTAAVIIDQDMLWRLCTRAIEPADARSHVTAHGASQLTDALLTIVSIIY